MNGRIFNKRNQKIRPSKPIVMPFLNKSPKWIPFVSCRLIREYIKYYIDIEISSNDDEVHQCEEKLYKEVSGGSPTIKIKQGKN